MHVRMLVLLAPLVLLLSLPAAAGGPGWTGTWDSRTGSGNQYIFKFVQSGSSVTGSYRGAGWEDSQASVPIENGTVSGNVLHFTEGDLYEYEFTMKSDGDSFTGRWGYLSHPGTWTGGTYTGERRSTVKKAKFRVDIDLFEEQIRLYRNNNKIYKGEGRIRIHGQGVVTADGKTGSGAEVGDNVSLTRTENVPNGTPGGDLVLLSVANGTLSSGAGGLTLTLKVELRQRSNRNRCAKGLTATLKLFDSRSGKDDRYTLGGWSGKCASHKHALTTERVKTGRENLNVKITCEKSTDVFDRASCG